MFGRYCMYYRRGWINKLERKIGKLAIGNLMLILVGAMAIVFIMDLALSPQIGVSLASRLYFDRDAILSGEIWRVLTFLFLPPESSIVFIVFALYLYYILGSALEKEWGAFGFTLFYLLGAIGAIASGFITGYATNYYINMSLFLAFAILNPDFELYVFFLLPVKMKWLSVLDGVLLILSFIETSWRGRVALLMALVNLLIFFTPQLIDRIKNIYRKWKWNQNLKK